MIDFKIKILGCVIGRRRIKQIQPPSSGLAKNFISKPTARNMPKIFERLKK